MNIKKLASMFGIETYEEENKQLHSDFDTLASAYDQVKGANNILAKQVIEFEDREENIKQREDYVIDLIADYEESKNKCEYMIDNMEALLKQAESRGINTGRQAAYAELGIANIEAHEMGGFLAILPDGEIVPLLSLEDFKDVYEGTAGAGPDDEIVLDGIV